MRYYLASRPSYISRSYRTFTSRTHMQPSTSFVCASPIGSSTLLSSCPRTKLYCVSDLPISAIAKKSVCVQVLRMTPSVLVVYPCEHVCPSVTCGYGTRYSLLYGVRYRKGFVHTGMRSYGAEAINVDAWLTHTNASFSDPLISGLGFTVITSSVSLQSFSLPLENYVHFTTQPPESRLARSRQAKPWRILLQHYSRYSAYPASSISRSFPTSTISL
jgi:hypothetical protein